MYRIITDRALSFWIRLNFDAGSVGLSSRMYRGSTAKALKVIYQSNGGYESQDCYEMFSIFKNNIHCLRNEASTVMCFVLWDDLDR